MIRCYRYITNSDIILFGEICNGRFSTTCIRDESIEELEEKIKLIHGYIMEHASGEVDNSSSELPEENQQVILKIYESFALAQDCIINELISLNSQLEECKKDLKVANISRNKPLVEKINRQIANLKIKENIFRKLADTIAWQFIQHHSTARRLYLNQATNMIKNTNIDSGIRFIRYFNENKQNFALLTDITSFIQIGDVLCSDTDKDGNRRWYLVELKEGDANYKVLRVIEGHDNDDKLDKKYLDQMQRILKQGKKAINALSVIKEGSGVDALGDKVKIIDSMDFEKDFFLDRVNEILNRCEKYGYSTDIIDDCLYIGAYNANIPIKKAYLAFIAWMASLGISYPILNLQDAFGCELCIPFFMSNIDKTNIIDIALGKKIILISLDFDKWINLGATIGLKSKWLSRKDGVHP